MQRVSATMATRSLSLYSTVSVGSSRAFSSIQNQSTPKLTSPDDLSDIAKLRPPTPPTGAKLSKIMQPRFPLPFMDSYRQWRGRSELKAAETAVLELGGVSLDAPNVKRLDVPVGNGLFLNELEIAGPALPSGEPNKHIVLIHGYGACKGFFYKNFQALGSIPGYTLHALDLLGYGLSSRPKFRIEAKDHVEGVLKAEDFFGDSLEQWRLQKGIDRFSLIAHSLGAYVGAAYAIKNRNVVDKLMLVSPAGVIRNHYSIPAEDVGSTDSYTPPGPVLSAPKYFEWLWDKRVSPFSLVRLTGPFGPRLTSGWTSRRFAKLTLPEQQALQIYSYVMFNAPGSGEYALSYLLAVGAQGRWPLSERTHALPCPSLWVYGDRDWMDIRGGHWAQKQIKKAGGKAEVVQMEDSGHHLYLDNVEGFNKLATRFIHNF